jgi:uncharacterized protein YyaL (SSP411 family)
MHANRLARETSPYLLQHARNPVDWFPWGDEAFTQARDRNKPIFLSVGYSTCYWCHVMERQCFENDDIAAVMNQHFINIKVDREERPDVDQLYMTALQLLTRHGGWPMSVWLTPDLRPFYAGTYFPPVEGHNLPAFPRLCDAIADAWRDRRDEIEASADQLVEALQHTAQSRVEPVQIDRTIIDRLVLRSCEDYEPTHGGFGRAPKFPRQTLLRLLLTWLDNTRDAADRVRVVQQLQHTLDAMADGGIRDQLAGGFHRYSTDSKWLVPHFEIMLYDQAMLARVYAHASRTLADDRYARVAQGICDFVLRDMTSPEGLFFTGFDAETNAREGATHLWTESIARKHLDADVADTFCRAYGLDQGPNFADPHHGNGAPDANVLFLAQRDLEDDPRVARGRAQLLEVRNRRPQPMLDTKVITSWNALMIDAMAYCGLTLGRDDYTQSAMLAASKLLAHHRDSSGTLFHVSRNGPARLVANLDDHAHLADALLTLADATRDARWRKQAESIVDQTLATFGDGRSAPYFGAAGQTDLIVRQKVLQDSPLPAGSAVLVRALLRLGRNDEACAIVRDVSGSLARFGEAMSATLEAAVLAFGTEPVSVHATVPLPVEGDGIVTLQARRTSKRRVDVTAHIKPGHHLYDTAIDSTLGLVPTRLRFAPGVQAMVESIDYPPAKRLELAHGPSVAGYTDSITLVVRFRGELPESKIELSLAYQACDDLACLIPSVARVEV